MTSKVLLEERNPRGIPKAPFIADVAEYLGGQGSGVEPTLKSFQEAIAQQVQIHGIYPDTTADKLGGKDSRHPENVGYG